VTTSFPTSLDTFSAKIDHSSLVNAADVNNLQDAVAALQALFHPDGTGGVNLVVKSLTATIPPYTPDPAIVGGEITASPVNGTIFLPKPSGVAATDTAAIQAVFNALTSAGAPIQARPGTYRISSSLTLPSWASVGQPQTFPIWLRGAGYMQDGFWHTQPFGTTFMAVGLAGDMFQGPSTNNIGTHFALEKMTLVGNDATRGATQSAGHLVHIYNPMESWFRDLEVYGAFGSGLFFDSAGVQGNLVTVDHCRFEKNGTYGINIQGTIQNLILVCHMESNLVGLFGSLAGADQSTIEACIIQNNTQQGVLWGGAQCRLVGNWIASNGREGVQWTGSGGIIEANQTNDNGSSTIDPKGIRLFNAVGCTVRNNISGAVGLGHQSYGFAEEGTSDFNNVEGNDLRGNVTAAVFPTPVGASTRFRGNRGYNPVGAVTTPGFPATTVVVTNTTRVDVVAYITNGTSAMTVQVDAVASLMVIPASQTGTVRIPASSTFKATYGGGAPSWVWYGE
jgi:hypothetical protein